MKSEKLCNGKIQTPEKLQDAFTLQFQHAVPPGVDATKLKGTYSILVKRVTVSTTSSTIIRSLSQKVITEINFCQKLKVKSVLSTSLKK